MPKYLIRKVYQYTEEVEVTADSERLALNQAAYLSGDRNHDDHLYDCEVIHEIFEDDSCDQEFPDDD